MSDVDDLLAEIEGTFAGGRKTTSSSTTAKSVSHSTSSRVSTTQQYGGSVTAQRRSTTAAPKVDDLLGELLDLTSDDRPTKRSAPAASSYPLPSSYKGATSGAGAHSSKWDDEDDEAEEQGRSALSARESKEGDREEEAASRWTSSSSSSSSSSSAWSGGGGGKCSNLCLAPDLPSCLPGVYRRSPSSSCSYYCDRLQCADCDFAVLRFPGGIWKTTATAATAGGGGGAPMTSSASLDDEDEGAGRAGGAGVSYMFFRNHVPNRSKLQTMIKEQQGCASYCCQCSWASLTPRDGVLTVKKASTGGLTMPAPAPGESTTTMMIVGGNGWGAWFCAGH